MRALLSTIGSRGDVQPLVALATELRAHGHESHLCVPPDFRDWIEGLGFAVTPIGPELRTMMAAPRSASTPPAMPSPEQRQRLAEASVAAQFETIATAARGCDVVVGATALQIAARSVAESLGIPYVFAAYCPVVLPSPHHAPPPVPLPGQPPAPSGADKGELWARDAARVHELFGAALNTHRRSLGLAPVSDVRRHIFSDQPWLAADPTLAPWPEPAEPSVIHTGAWILADDRPLGADLEAFLDAGEPPIYFGFGSMRAPQGLAESMVEAARALGRRAIVLRGWGGLAVADGAADCIAVDEVNHQALLRRVAAAVHHGGAGTTTAAALAGAPQVVVPQIYDQHYWAERVDRLGVGTAHAPGAITAESLTHALDRALRPEVRGQAASLAAAVTRDGARAAAEALAALA